ncbi:MAG: UDP-N-acetylmuramate dehydrogenase [Candidatus Moranbacteria bacterium]|nr:UDP-N-acetylmuramate dehydrogenase [Candidatus Moranbacteria bacterium]
MSADIQKNVLLAPYTTFKIGGPAKFFAEAKNEKEIIEVVRFSKENNLETFVLAGGSNILVNDDGFDGVVLRMRNTSIEIGDRVIHCGAGAKFSEVVLKSVRNNLSGLEWAIGVPGDIGGAIRGNAGCFGGEISELVKEVKVLNMDNFEIETYTKKDCKFSYRNSIFKENKHLLVVSAVFELSKGEKKESQKILRDIVLKRNSAQPKNFSAGSFFKNPKVDNNKIIQEFEKDTGKPVKDGIVPAAWIIESLGLKGEKIGGATVSKKHANFIINSGQASAKDVIMLSSIIKQKAREEFGIQLQEEVQMVGF